MCSNTCGYCYKIFQLPCLLVLLSHQNTSRSCHSQSTQIGQWYGNKAVRSRPRKEPYRPTVKLKFRNRDRDLLCAVTTGVKPAADEDGMTLPAVDTGHDSDDSEDLLPVDDVEDGLIDDEVPDDIFMQVDEESTCSAT
ncbi:hypothetical protein BDR05DRAFT_319629 [Suillus weaverae]|nr:hypothetical protein BDR05DRAFT_319629 [Suillus weaverae]